MSYAGVNLGPIRKKIGPKALERAPLAAASRPQPLPAHLLVRIHVDVALNALLTHVGPRVPAHPFSLALGTLVLAETALFALVRGQTLTFGACLEDRKQTQRALGSTRPT